MAQVKETAIVLNQKKLSADVYDMWILSESIAALAKPGQFVTIYPKDSSRLLPRPISICEIGEDKNQIRIVYRVVGGGTEEFSRYQKGDAINIMGPLGNGYPLDVRGKRALLIGGGIGIPPLLELAKQLPCEKQMVLGYKDALFLNREFVPYGRVYIATEDGSIGTVGNVMDAIEANHLDADLVFACGPTPMLRALKAFAARGKKKCWLSLEERMACGVGACLGCVCKSSEADSHTHVHNKRVCKDGPVFAAEEVEL